MFYKKVTFNSIFKYFLVWFFVVTYAITSLFFTIHLCTRNAQVSSYSNKEGELTATTVATQVETYNVEYISVPILFIELDYFLLYDIIAIEEQLTIILNNLDTLDVALASGRYSTIAAMQMESEHVRLLEVYIKFKTDLDKYKTWEKEYYNAAKTFLFLKQNGYSDAIACGIIGNMMIETSGGSLALKPNIYDPSGKYYGLCQWDLNYYPAIEDAPLTKQLEFLMDTILLEFETFGRLYSKNFTHDTFLSLTDTAEAAYAFAKVYERCHSYSFAARKQAAKVAYEYFMLSH